MKIYKVGGCIRDRLLNIPINDKDYVVVGGSIEEMIKLGFKPVGKDFPVFLHPTTNEEYSLARSERKVFSGYKGFEFYTDKNISIEDDLRRRDITINAIAEDELGNIIDPFNGISDLKNRIIRHVSESFVEDPLRVFRVARFKAKLSFDIAPETFDLMKKIVSSDELFFLSKERIWMEIQTALCYPDVIYFFEVLEVVGVYTKIMKELSNLFTFPRKDDFFNSLTKFFYIYSYEFNFSILVFFLGYKKDFDLALFFIKNSYVNNKSKSLAKLLINTYQVILNYKTISDMVCLIKLLDCIRQKDRYCKLIKLLNAILIQINNKKLFIVFEKMKKICYEIQNFDIKGIVLENNDDFVNKIIAKKNEIIERVMNDSYE